MNQRMKLSRLGIGGANMFDDTDDERTTWSAEDWKEWCLNEN